MGVGRAEYFLKTKSLGFRTWRDDDFAIARGLWGDPKVMELIDSRGGLTDEQVRERLALEIESQVRFGVQYWPFFLLATGEHVGCCGLRNHNASKGIYELGFHILPAYWRRGYATEASRAVTLYAFDELRVQALYAGHHPTNEASRSVLLKLGFRHIGDELYAPTGLRHPSYLLSRKDYVRQRIGKDPA
jgi:RimJ/RimL family protein N-acetyltransferase